jgi:hypothetical protein
MQLFSCFCMWRNSSLEARACPCASCWSVFVPQSCSAVTCVCLISSRATLSFSSWLQATNTSVAYRHGKPRNKYVAKSDPTPFKNGKNCDCDSRIQFSKNAHIGLPLTSIRCQYGKDYSVSYFRLCILWKLPPLISPSITIFIELWGKRKDQSLCARCCGSNTAVTFQHTGMFFVRTETLTLDGIMIISFYLI